MSHFVKITTEITDCDALVRALTRMGYKNAIEFCKEAKRLKDYWGNLGQLQGNVILHRESIGSHADIGFEKMKDGTYAVHIDSYDKESQHNGKFDSVWQSKLTTLYGVEKAKSELEKRHLSYIEDVDEKERPRIRVKI